MRSFEHARTSGPAFARSAVMEGIGLVRSALGGVGLSRRPRFRKPGHHTPTPTAPLVLVACSGGRDSLCLALLTSIVAGELGLRAGAVIIDHRLQEGSSAVADKAARQCRHLGLRPVRVKRIRVSPLLAARQGTEAAARRARYKALAHEARLLRARAVLLAHTCDDQAETLLLALLSGSSPTALTGMPASFTRGGVLFLRPILALTRAQTTAICRRQGLSWWDDPTNGQGVNVGDPAFGRLPLRSRVRQGLLPLFKRLGGEAVTRHLADIARSQRRDQDFLDEEARKAFARVVVEEGQEGGRVRVLLQTSAVRTLPTALRTRVLVDALSRLVEKSGGRPAGAPVRPDLPAWGVNRRSVETLDRYVRGLVPVHVFQISSKLSAFRKGPVTVLCHNNSHADR